jgi:hypothetical protein
MYRIVLAMMVIAAAAGCGTGRASTEPYPARNRTILFPDEISQYGTAGRSAYDLIRQLRPEFLRSRGVTSLRDLTPPTATVYLDGVKYGDLNSLKLISAEQLTRVQYLNGSEATTRYGTDHVGGAILITTK